MIVFKKSWKGFGTVLIITGVALLYVLFCSLKQYLIDGDYFAMIVLLLLGLLFIVSGILVIRWARKNGKE